MYSISERLRDSSETNGPEVYLNFKCKDQVLVRAGIAAVVTAVVLAILSLVAMLYWGSAASYALTGSTILTLVCGITLLVYQAMKKRREEALQEDPIEEPKPTKALQTAMQNENQKLNAANDALHQDVDRLKGENQKLQERLAQQQSKGTTNTDDLQKKINELKSQVDLHLTTIGHLNQDKLTADNHHNQVIQQIQKEINDFKKALIKSQADLTEARKELAKWANAEPSDNKMIEALMADVNKRHQKEVEELCEKNFNLEQKNTQAESEIKALKRHFEQFNNTVNDLKQELETTKKKAADDLSEQYKKADAAESAHGRELNNLGKQWELKCKQWVDDCQRSQNKCQTLSNELFQKNKELLEAQVNYKVLSEKFDNLNQDLTAKLLRQNQELQAAKAARGKEKLS